MVDSCTVIVLKSSTVISFCRARADRPSIRHQVRQLLLCRKPAHHAQQGRLCLYHHYHHIAIDWHTPSTASDMYGDLDEQQYMFGPQECFFII